MAPIDQRLAITRHTTTTDRLQRREKFQSKSHGVEPANDGRRKDGLKGREKPGMPYVDGFVAAVPTANRERFRAHAEAAAVVFKECGALKVVECWGMTCRKGR